MSEACAAIELLTRGAVTIRGRMPWASNATFLAEIALDGETTLGVLQARAWRAAPLGLPRASTSARSPPITSRGARLGPGAAHRLP